MSHIPQRTHYAGLIGTAEIGTRITVNGWVDSHRDLGSLLFFDVRDRAGIVQCVVEPTAETMFLYEEGKVLRAEYVVSIEGIIRKRSNPNPRIPTGDIEIVVESIVVLNEAEVPPFVIEDDVKANEDLRLKYRYLDLRRPKLQRNLMIRHRITKSIRDHFDARGFMEVETPMLMKATPEGARDFLVPSRVHPGEFYALPQSPQIYKQILMVAGLDRYFQIVKCFRDEDLRADRQPEFTQLDVEMSFPDEEMVYEKCGRMSDLISRSFHDTPIKKSWSASAPINRICDTKWRSQHLRSNCAERLNLKSSMTSLKRSRGRSELSSCLVGQSGAGSRSTR
jgi:aspartyl-tRNA synthetase